MSFLDETVKIPRRTMTIFFMVDTSGSMTGSKIGAVNEAVQNVVPVIREISSSSTDAEIRIAALGFSDGARWLYDEPKPAADFQWKDLTAGGRTDLGAACTELESKLHRSGFMKSAAGSFAPAVIILSDGGPTDRDFEKRLEALWGNGWFRHAIKFAIAIGEDADMDILAGFTGDRSSVFSVSSIDDLRRMIRFVSVTSAQIGSRGNTAAGAPVSGFDSCDDWE